MVLLALLAVVLHLTPIETWEDSGVSFKAVDALEVVRVYISNKTGTIDITFTGEGYQVDDIPADVVDVKKLIDLLSACGTVYALRAVTPIPRIWTHMA